MLDGARTLISGKEEIDEFEVILKCGKWDVRARKMIVFDEKKVLWEVETFFNKDEAVAFAEDLYLLQDSDIGVFIEKESLERLLYHWAFVEDEC